VKVIENQKIYQCSHCGKRLLTKKGAKIHEENYCRVILKKQKEELQNTCPHMDTDWSYRYIPGEAVKEPDYCYCLDCGKVL
jgi:hypothetical protein